MRSNYDDAEQLALTSTLALISDEYRRQIDIVTAYLKHLVICEDGTHRATIATRASSCISNLITQLRYAGWLEAELTPQRVFPEPARILKEFTDIQDAVIAEIKAKEEAKEQKTAEAVAPVAEGPRPYGIIAEPVQETPAFTEHVQEPAVNTIGVQALEMDRLATVPLVLTLQ